MDQVTRQKYSSLLQSAAAAGKNSYAPYSGELRGAALLAADGQVYCGATVEFATYGGSVCAELAALVKAVGEGQRSFKAVALTPHRFPCGMCRQFLSEFGIELDVVLEGRDGLPETFALKELFPESFGKESLQK